MKHLICTPIDRTFKVHSSTRSTMSAELEEVLRFGERGVRVVGTYDDPWFCGNDVARALGYARPRDAVLYYVRERDRRRLEDILADSATTASARLKSADVMQSIDTAHSLVDAVGNFVAHYFLQRGCSCLTGIGLTHTDLMTTYITAAGVQSLFFSGKLFHSSRGERECHRAIESITGRVFRRARPEWLINIPTDQRLELDCYNAELSIAVEYNGQQHYKYTRHYHASPTAFQESIRRDVAKQRLCTEHGVTLIVVPYTVATKTIETYIRSHLGAVRLPSDIVPI
jgi:hypothetical protein